MERQSCFFLLHIKVPPQLNFFVHLVSLSFCKKSNISTVMHTENRSDRTKCPELLKSIGHNVLTPQKQ